MWTSLAALAFAAPGSAAMHYGASLAIAWLALTAWGTVLLGRPFTEGIARRSVSADIAAPGHTLLLVAVKVGGFTIPAVFTARYPAIAQKRHFAGLTAGARRP